MIHERIEAEGGTLFVLSGSMELGRLDRFRFDALSVPSESSPSLLLDLTGVELIDSSGFGVLIELLKRANELGGELILCGLRDYPEKVMRLLRLDRHLRVFREREEALAAMARVRTSAE